MNITLKNLSLEGFRSFLKESSVQFPANGLLLLGGLDTRTGGSNGSGKSSFLEAIAFANGANMLPATELKNYNSKSMGVTQEIQIGTDLWKIRKTSTQLTANVNGKDLPGTKSELQSKIEEALGNLSVYTTLTYRHQDDKGKFLYTADAELKKFFTQCIPELDKVETEHDKASAQVSALTKVLDEKREAAKVLIASRDQESLQKMDSADYSLLLGQLETARNDVRIHEKNLLDIDVSVPFKMSVAPHEQRIEQLKAEIASLVANQTISAEDQTKIDQLEIAISKLLPDNGPLEEVEAYVRTIQLGIDELDQKLKLLPSTSTFDDQIRPLEQSLAGVRTAETDIAAKKVKAKGVFDATLALKTELAKLEANVCPTCDRTWDAAQVRAEKIRSDIQANSEALASIRAEIQAAPDFQSQKVGLQEQIQSVQKSRQEILSQTYLITAAIEAKKTESFNFRTAAATKRANEHKALRLELVNFKNSLNMSRDNKKLQLRNEISELEQKISKIKSDMVYITSNSLSKARTLLAGIEQAITKESAIQATVARMETQIATRESEIQTLQKEFDLEDSVAKSLKGLLGEFFEGLLQEIENDTNDMLAIIPNCADIAVRISSYHEAKNGNSKSKISTTISKFGQDISFKSLSGGQRASISFCADMAMMFAIRNRTNIRPNYLALDEPFNGMDLRSKEAAVEILKRFSDKNLIIVIDHATELKESFDSSIMVKYDGVTSSIDV